MSDCDAVEDPLRVVKLGKYSLLALLDIYEGCENRILPLPKWGVFGGLSIETLKPREIKSV